MSADLRATAVAEFFKRVERVDEDRHEVHTTDGCLYSFGVILEVDFVRWTVVKFGDASYLPFCLDEFWAKRRSN